jgi:hypothetical protein
MVKAESNWRPREVLALVLIVGGVLGLVYGGFRYVSGYRSLDIGVTVLSWRHWDTLHVPVWAGVAAVAIGAYLMFFRKEVGFNPKST